MAALGGIRDVEGSQNSVEIENLARFAVQEHNKKEVFIYLCCLLDFILLLYFSFLRKLREETELCDLKSHALC